MIKTTLKTILIAIFTASVVLAVNSCALLAYQALTLRVEPARGTFPESAQYSKIDGLIYYNSWDSTGKLHQSKIKDADSGNFRVLVLKNRVVIGNDGTHVYLLGEELFGVDAKTFEAITLLRPDSLGEVAESNEYVFRDLNCVYRQNDGHLEVVEGADSDSFQRINGYWAKDKYHYYLLFRKVDFAETESFQVLDGPWARDAKGIYLENELISIIDSATFVPIPGSILFGLGKDKYHVFWAGKVVPDADPETFQLIGNDKAVDKNYVFTFFPYAKRDIEPDERKKYKL